jgi:hypothetical protein
VLFVSPTDFGLPCPPTPLCQIVGALLPLLSPHARTLLFHTRLDTGVLDVGRRADFGAEPTFRFPALLNSPPNITTPRVSSYAHGNGLSVNEIERPPRKSLRVR